MSWGFWTLLIGVTFYLSFLLPKYHVRWSSDHRVRPSQKMNISSWKLSKSQKDMVSQPLGSNDATICKSICKFNGIILIASMYNIFTAYIYHKHQPKVNSVGKYNIHGCYVRCVIGLFGSSLLTATNMPHYTLCGAHASQISAEKGTQILHLWLCE